MDKLQLQRERAAFNRATAELVDERLAAMSDRERATLERLAHDVAREFPRMGEKGAMELLYRVGIYLNEKKMGAKNP